MKPPVSHKTQRRDLVSQAGLCARNTGRAKQWILASLVLAGAALGLPASAKGVAAGTQVQNTVVVSYVVGGVTQTGTASTSFVVDQLVDLTTTWQDAGPVPAAAGAVAQVLVFRLTNTGNGSDSYTLAPNALPASGTGFVAAQCRLFLDQGNSGSYSSSDPAYVPGSNDPALAAGAHVDLFALCDLPSKAADGSFAKVQLAATSKTLSGKPGSAKPATGTPGMTVVVGMSGGTSSSIGSYQASAVSYQLTSTQQVIDKSGGSVATSGSRIRYKLIVTSNGGSASGRNLVVTNPMPEHTVYVPGSLTLDSAALGDGSADNDAGDFNSTASNAIAVRLGNVPGTSRPHIITFEVSIN